MGRLAALVTVGVLALAGAAFGSSKVDLRVVGTEVPPISSTRGTFVGASQGPVGAWRIQIRHEALQTGPTVAITGGSLLIALRTGTALRSSVVGGSVTVKNTGASCTTQVYAVHVAARRGHVRRDARAPSPLVLRALRDLRGDDQRARAAAVPLVR